MVNTNNTSVLHNSNIPSDWEIIELGQLFDFKNGINAGKESYGKGVKFINVMEVIYNDSITSEMISGTVQITDEQKQLYLVKNGDVLFNRTSETTNEIGLTSVYYGNNDVVFGGFVIRGRPINNSVDDKFKRYCFRSKIVRDQIIKGGQGAVRTNIGQGDLEKVKVILPPLPEQKAIAHILGLMDTAINKSNLLIKKKELQKKWLMQMLLTGKKRLKGFSGEWGEIKIGDVFDFVKSYSHSRDNLTYDSVEGSIYNIHYGDIHAVFENDVLDMQTANRIPYLKKEFGDEFEFLKDGDIIIADASEDYEGVGESVEIKNIGNKKVIGGLHTIVLRDNSNKTVDDFRAFLFNGERVLNSLRKVATGISVYGISKSNIASVKISLPSKEEQTAIAQILQAADKEIQLLKSKTEKLRDEKKGLMQVLLTGKKRLKYDTQNI